MRVRATYARMHAGIRARTHAHTHARTHARTHAGASGTEDRDKACQIACTSVEERHVVELRDVS